MSSLEAARTRARELAREAGLLDAAVEVTAEPLTPEEAIGTPGRRDFPIVLGVERVIEARVGDARGHAFTDAPGEIRGTLAEVLDLPLDTSRRRAIVIATLNALLRGLGRVEATVHCRDDDPERCGAEIAAALAARLPGGGVVGLVGLNPAILDHLVRAFGPGRVRVTDLNPDAVGGERFGVPVWDGATRTDDLIDAADVVLLTGTTLANGTFDAIWRRIAERGKTGVVFGVTASAVAALLGYERVCPYGR